MESTEVKPTAGRLRQRRTQGFCHLLFRGRGNDLGDQILRGVLEDSRGLTRGVAHDDAAHRVRCRARHTGQFDGQRIRQDGMPIVSAEEGGMFPLTASIIWRVGSLAEGHACSSQSPPSASARTLASPPFPPMRRVNSSSLRASFRLTERSWKPPQMKCAWLSINPGTARRPFRSTTLVFAPA